MGPVTHRGLVRRFGSAEAALDRLPTLISGGRGGKPPTLADVSDIKAELEATRALGGKVLLSCDPDFPPLLAALDPPPPVISVCGRLELLGRPACAIVGSRDASAVGRKMARDLAKGLSEEGYVIVSGLARGIDGEAHSASLARGTIAVLAGGLSHIYPPEHEALHAAIAEQGVLVSESRPHHNAKAADFPRRNRLITGLALGVVVVEAAQRSGSLISARTALEQGREVMAVPGSPLDPRARGTNGLIRQGATLVETVSDVVAALSQPPPQRGLFDLPEAEYVHDDVSGRLPEGLKSRVADVLSPTPMPIVEIARAADIAPARCAAVLVELELEGIALTVYGGLAGLRPS